MTKKDNKTKLSIYRATLIAEGVEQPDNDEQYIEAWQLLIDTGTVWKLQGWFGRTATNLIAEGICTMKTTD